MIVTLTLLPVSEIFENDRNFVSKLSYQCGVYLSNQESDVEASFSSHDSDEEGATYGVKRFKRDIAEDVFEENGNRNGMGSPVVEHELMDTTLNGGHGNDLPRDG